jgi:hypothetical protein
MPNSNTDVSSGAPHPESYTVHGDGTVTDNVTGLMWQQGISSVSYQGTASAAYCASLTLGGHCDWRVPTRIELASIMDYSQLGGSATFASNNEHIWTSTPFGTVGYWYVDFDYGFVSYAVSTSLYYARCVR